MCTCIADGAGGVWFGIFVWDFFLSEHCKITDYGCMSAELSSIRVVKQKPTQRKSTVSVR